MNRDNLKHGSLSAVLTMAENSQHEGNDSRRLPADAGSHVSFLASVEEIFLEGDSAVVLHHEAGSARAIDLLESADSLDSATAEKG
jgi:hypothetical protein